MNIESYMNRISLISGSIVFLLYLFTFSMLSESRWRYLADYGDGPTIFVIPIAYFAIGILLVFWLISFCISVVKLLSDSNSLTNQRETSEILQNNLIRHLRIIGISLVSIVALEFLPNPEVNEEISVIIVVALAFFIPVVIAIYDILLPTINSIFLPRWTFSGWFSALGLGVILAIPLSDLQQATKFGHEFFNTLWGFFTDSEENQQVEYFVISSAYLFLAAYYAYKTITQWEKISSDVYMLYRKLRYLFSKLLNKEKSQSA